MSDRKPLKEFLRISRAIHRQFHGPNPNRHKKAMRDAFWKKRKARKED